MLLSEGPVDDQLLHLLVAEVDDELLEPVLFESLEPVDVENAEDFVLPVGFHLNKTTITVFVLYLVICLSLITSLDDSLYFFPLKVLYIV